MSVIVILLLPLVAAAACLHSIWEALGAGRDGRILPGDLILIARLARQVVAGHAPGELLDASVVEMDRRGRLERADFAADCAGR